MNATPNLDSIAFDSTYQPPDIIRDYGSSSVVDREMRTAVSTGQPFLSLASWSRRIHRRARSISGTWTDVRDRAVDSEDVLTFGFDAKTKRAQADRLAYRMRIATLCDDAKRDGYVLNPASEHDFWQFVRAGPLMRKGNVVLMDNGNLRAVWKDGSGTHIGLQFLGGQVVQYMVFKQRAAASLVSRVAGRDSFDGLRRQIEAFDLQPLVYA